MSGFIEIIEQSDYHIKWKYNTNLEEIGEDFLTEDEFREIIGETNSYSLIYGGIHQFREKVKEKLTEIKQFLINNNKKSTIVDDEDLVEFLTNRPINWYITGLRRTGNRFSLSPKKKKNEKSKIDGKNFINHAINAIRKKYTNNQNEFDCFQLNIKGGMEKVCEPTIRFIVASISWEEIEEYCRNVNCSKISDEELELYKSFYNDPTIFNK